MRSNRTHLLPDLKEIERGLASGIEAKYWKAAADMCEYAEEKPEFIWNMVVKYGSHRAPDLRMAIATCVLEHVLEYHFREYFPKIEVIILSGNQKFRDTLMSCWKFGESLKNKNLSRWEKLVWKSASKKEKESITYWKKRNKYKKAAESGEPKAVLAYKRFLSK